MQPLVFFIEALSVPKTRSYKVHSHRHVAALHGNVWFRTNNSSLSWNRQGSWHKLNYCTSANRLSDRGNLSIHVILRRVSNKHLFLSHIWEHVFMNTLPYNCEIWCPGREACRFQTSKSICCQSNSWLWTLKEIGPWQTLFSTKSLLMVWMKYTVSLTLCQWIVFKLFHKTCFAIWQKSHI